MISPKKPVLAIDFDRAIVENKYPSFGKQKLFAFETLKILRIKSKDFSNLFLKSYK